MQRYRIRLDRYTQPAPWGGGRVVFEATIETYEREHVDTAYAGEWLTQRAFDIVCVSPANTGEARLLSMVDESLAEAKAHAYGMARRMVEALEAGEPYPSFAHLNA